MTLNISITVCGPIDSGKTSLIKRIVDKTFIEQKQPSYTEFQPLSITVDGYQIQTSLIERNDEAFMKQASTDPGARGDILLHVYNIESEESFQGALNVFKYFSRLNDASVMCLVGNYSDTGKREVNKENVMKEITEPDCYAYKISAKTGTGVEEMIKDVIHNYLTSQSKTIQAKIEPFKGKNKKGAKKGWEVCFVLI
ncbi:hypothetical protein EIN_505690, partial [Entamoeba invadens IP1]